MPTLETQNGKIRNTQPDFGATSYLHSEKLQWRGMALTSRLNNSLILIKEVDSGLHCEEMGNGINKLTVLLAPGYFVSFYFFYFFF